MRKATFALVIIAIGFLNCSGPQKWSPPVLDAQSISDLPAEELAYQAYEALFDSLGSKWNGDVKPILTGPRQWRLVYTTLWLEADVNNGGFHQYFWNCQGEANAETLVDLQEIGADTYVEIFKNALDVFSKYNYAVERSASGDNWEAFTKGYDEERFEALDQSFFERTDTIAGYVGQYIKNNPAKYLEHPPN